MCKKKEKKSLSPPPLFFTARSCARLLERKPTEILWGFFQGRRHPLSALAFFVRAGEKLPFPPTRNANFAECVCVGGCKARPKQRSQECKPAARSPSCWAPRQARPLAPLPHRSLSVCASSLRVCRFCLNKRGFLGD